MIHFLFTDVCSPSNVPQSFGNRMQISSPPHAVSKSQHSSQTDVEGSCDRTINSDSSNSIQSEKCSEGNASKRVECRNNIKDAVKVSSKLNGEATPSLECIQERNITNVLSVVGNGVQNLTSQDI